MSRSNEILIIQTSADEVRIARACVEEGAGPDSARGRIAVRLSDVCFLTSQERGDDASPLGDQLVLDELAAHLRDRGLEHSRAVFVIGGSSVSCQYFDMPPLAGKAMRQAVTLKLGKQLHFPVEQSVLMIRVLDQTASNSEGQVRVQATAVRREVVDDALAAADRLGLKVLAMTAAPDVLAAAASDLVPSSEGLRAVLDLEERHSTFVVLHRGQPCVCAELPISASDITAALMRPIISGEDVLQLDACQAVELRGTTGIPDSDTQIESLGIRGEKLLPLLEPVLQKFVKQLTQWLTFASTSAGGTVERLELVGLGSTIRGLTQAIASRLALEVGEGGVLQDAVMVEDDASSDAVRSFGTAALAACYLKSLPDLVPSEIRREQRLSRIRRGLAVCGPVVAAAIIGFAVLFDRVDEDVQPALASRQLQLSEIEHQIEVFRQAANHARRISDLEGQFSGFGRENPHWVGVFKELSLLLPSELQATEYLAESRDGNVVLTVRATVVTDSRGRDFDEVVTQVLLHLQRSSFFKRVEIASANREQGGANSTVAGVISVELDLAYPSQKARA